VKDISINLDGTHIAVACDGDDSPVMFALGGSLPPAPVKITSPDPSFYPLTSADFRIGFVFPPIPEGKVFLREIIEDICDRCGLPASKYDVSALDDIVDGITLGGAYSGAGAITTLMPAYFFDLFEADKKINAVKRGAAVKDTVVLADLIEEPDENSLRGQDTEYPRQLIGEVPEPGPELRGAGGGGFPQDPRHPRARRGQGRPADQHGRDPGAADRRPDAQGHVGRPERRGEVQPAAGAVGLAHAFRLPRPADPVRRAVPDPRREGRGRRAPADGDRAP